MANAVPFNPTMFTAQRGVFWFYARPPCHRQNLSFSFMGSGWAQIVTTESRSHSAPSHSAPPLFNSALPLQSPLRGTGTYSTCFSPDTIITPSPSPSVGPSCPSSLVLSAAACVPCSLSTVALTCHPPAPSSHPCLLLGVPLHIIVEALDAQSLEEAKSTLHVLSLVLSCYGTCVTWWHG